MSAMMTKVEDLAGRYEKTLKGTASNPVFNPSTVVMVRHEDQTTYTFHSAFMLVLVSPEYDDGGNEDGWLMVFTEHHGYHVFSIGDLEWYGQYLDDDSGDHTFPLEKFKQNDHDD